MQQTSRGKFDRLQRATAGFTSARLDGYGLRCSLPTRPRAQASYPVLVHRHTLLLHASFRPRLATTPLRFANPSPPSGWIRDSHPQTVEHARHTKTRWRAWKTRKRFSTFAPATTAGCSHKASWPKLEAVSMVDGTGGSIGTEQRVVFQSLGPHNPTLTSNPAVPPHRLGKPRA